MNSRHFKNEGWLYGLAFLLALGLRLIKLGALPLTDAEATAALQALHIAQGLKPALGPQPVYILLTAPLFFGFGGATNFLARMVPALAGSALVFVPFLFRERLKSRPSLILAFFFALEPGLVTLSREAASGILAITFFLFAWGCWRNNRSRLAGAFAALTLLSGPSIWAGLLAFGITWAIHQGMQARPANKKQSSIDAEEPLFESPISTPSPKGNIEFRPALISFIITLLIAGTLFFTVPNGLSAAVASLPAYIHGWTVSSGTPSSRLFLSLLIYQPIAVVLALLAIGRGWWYGSRRIIQLSLWLLVALLLAVFYPSRQVSDLAWMLIPLWALAALELVRHLGVVPNERNEIIGVVVLTTFILIFIWLDLASLIWNQLPSPSAQLRLWLLFGSFFLLVLSILLVAFGWSFRSARLGAIWGVTIALSLVSLRGMLGAAGMHGVDYPELWPLQTRPLQADILTASINDLSDWGEGNKNALPVVITGINSPALEWTLRNHQISVVAALDPATSPAFVITPPQSDPNLAASYRGQDFTWRQTPSWETANLNDWIRWIVLREMPQNGETIILWARDDLFLNGSPRPIVP